MTTAEFIVCRLLHCGEWDIEELFDKLTSSEYFSNAVDELKAQRIELTAESIWFEAIEQALADVFGNVESFDVFFNYMDSHVTLNVSRDEVEDYQQKADKFYELTGFEIEE